jgi:GR25 family glycosyltransferase involved in LPS biosynthesis
MSDAIFEESLKKLEPKMMPLQLKKLDAVKGAELGTIINDRDILTIGALHDISVPENRRTHAELGTKNAIGCYLSHAALWTKLVDSDCDGFFVFESDAVCHDNVVKVVSEFIDTKKDFDILFLGNFWLNLADKSKYKKINKRFYGTHAYYITKNGAKKCLKYAFPIEQQLDSYLSDLVLLSEKKNQKPANKKDKKDTKNRRHQFLYN